MLGAASAEAKGCGEKDRSLRLAKELNLTQEQLEKVKEIKSKYKARFKEGGAAVKAAKQDLIASVQAPKRDDAYSAELMAKFKKTQDLKKDLHQARFEMALEIRSLLTDEQIAKFKALPRHHGFHHDRDEEDEG